MIEGVRLDYPEQSPLTLIYERTLTQRHAMAVQGAPGPIRYKDLELDSLESLARQCGLASLYQFPPAPAGIDAPAYINTTSGTMGAGKMVARSYRNIVSRLAWEQYGRGQVHLIYPTNSSLTQLLIVLAWGARAYITGRQRAELLTGARESNATHITLLPLHWKALAEARVPLPWLQEAVSIGDRLTAEVRNTFAAAYPAPAVLHNAYGSTEAGYIAVDGVPVANARVWIARGDRLERKEAPAGVVGSVVVEGPGVALGYFSPQVPLFSGQFVSQDRGRIVDGRLELVGRL
jgi:non-ribosomal peptide synthetase component F